MQAANEAEARGDACAAFEILASRPIGPDGKLFWRPERIRRLEQLMMLDPCLPRWATSRWILTQAMQMMEPTLRAAHKKALAITVELRGGVDALTGRDETDAMAKVIEHDWVFRQLMLYEYGGLAVFLRTSATPDLIAGADRIHDWVAAPMRVLQFTGRSPRILHLSDVKTGEAVEVLDLGSAALLLPQDCLLGRLVPTGDGTIFESIPLRVPMDIAVDAAADPTRWLAALQRGARVERPEMDEVTTAILHGTNLLTDVPDLVWQLAALEHGGTDADDLTVDSLVEATFGMIRAVIAEQIEVHEDLVDPCSLVSAALVSPMVLDRLDEGFSVEDAPGLRTLAARLVEPAAEICRDLAESAQDVA